MMVRTQNTIEWSVQATGDSINPPKYVGDGMKTLLRDFFNNDRFQALCFTQKASPNQDNL